jgi:carbon storage regulator
MLVLSRKPGERILIGSDITVTIVRIGPNNVRLGIEAPRDMNIVREELCIKFPELNPNEPTSTESSPASTLPH